MELIRKILPGLVAAFILLGLGYAAGYRAGSAERFVPMGGGNVAYALDSKTGMRCYTDDRLPMPPAEELRVNRALEHALVVLSQATLAPTSA